MRTAAKATLFLATAAFAAAGLTHSHPFAPFPPFPADSSPTFPHFPEKISLAIGGVLRSSRAFSAIALTAFDYKFSLHGLPSDSGEYRRKLAEVHLRSAKRILKLCEVNKGFYVKAGQFVAALRQVPKEYSSILSSLQDQAVPCHFKVINEVLSQNLGQDFSEIFLSLDENPIAAASIAQVHRAVLMDGKEVAIKVQYPGLQQLLRIDTTTMSFLSQSVAWFFPEYRFEWLVSEFVEDIVVELGRLREDITALRHFLGVYSEFLDLKLNSSLLVIVQDIYATMALALDASTDFVQEARNSEKTANNFKNNKWVKVPRVFWDLTTNQVLTMEFCRGQKVDDLAYMKSNGIDPSKVAKTLVEVFAEMIFVHGFLHGDPHPGNILVCPEGQDRFSLVLLDHGIYRQLDEEFRLNYCELWKALILLDSVKIQHLGEQFGVAKYSKYFPVIFTGRTIDSKVALGRGMSTEEKDNLKKELTSIKMEDISSFMESLPPDFLRILRMDGLLRSIIRQLGASQQVRLLAYAKFALRGLSQKPKHESDFSIEVILSRLKTKVSYLQLRLTLVALEAFHRLTEVLKYVYSWYANIGGMWKAILALSPQI